MRARFAIPLFLIAMISRILANPLYRHLSVGLCDASGTCTGRISQCCSTTSVLLCNDSGMLERSNCARGGVCVNMSDTLAECQPADICDDVHSQCSDEVFSTKCCADRTRFAACLNNKLSILQCSTKGSCINDGPVVRCQ
jgi:hypothetical protein